MMNETNPTDAELASTSESKPLGQQHEASPPPDSFANVNRRPNLPIEDLFTGERENHLRIGVPLYEASISCNWEAAESILNGRPELVRYSLTKNGETALHIAVTVKRSEQAETFVANLVYMMKEEDLALQNKSFNTALYLAATAGNLKMVMIMMSKNYNLANIPGARGMMPLYAAALFGNYEVVKYLYEISRELFDDSWNPMNRGLLLETCVEADMFDVALNIVESFPQLGNGSLLLSLARKTHAFSVTKPSIIKRSIDTAFALFGSTAGIYEKESEALQLLRIIWKDIIQRPMRDIDYILRGSPDSIRGEEKLTQENGVLALQLQILISEYLDKLEVETHNIMGGQPMQDTQLVSRKTYQARELRKLISQHLKSIHVESKNLINQDNKAVSSKRNQALQLQYLIKDHIFEMHAKTQKIINETFGEENEALKLQKLVNKQITFMRTSTISKVTHSSQVTFIAAEMGNTLFLIELIRLYPDLIWKVNDEGYSIFHIAVKYRHVGVYNLLYEIGSMKDLVMPLKDVDGNNMLHLAGKLTTKERLADVSGAALQMQRELLWFNEVRNMIPPSYRERRNKAGLTPRELFTEEHTELIREGEKWMKEAASQCMVVAALIATIVFAAAFTVPGGYNQNDGIPIFYQKPVFIAFVVADAMSLFLSSTSILTFLSILTSRYAERDFVESLPRKLMLGISTLFLSITAMMITFSVSFFILYHREMKWIPIFISLIAFVPVLLYVVLQYHVLADVIRSTYGSKYLFKPQKQVLYYVNPRV